MKLRTAVSLWNWFAVGWLLGAVVMAAVRACTSVER